MRAQEVSLGYYTLSTIYGIAFVDHATQATTEDNNTRHSWQKEA